MLSTAKHSTKAFANDAKNAAENIGETGREAAETMATDLRSVAHRAGQEARRVYTSAKDELGYAADTVGEQIRNRPVQSSLIALGAGVVLGLLFGRR